MFVRFAAVGLVVDVCFTMRMIGRTFGKMQRLTEKDATNINGQESCEEYQSFEVHSSGQKNYRNVIEPQYFIVAIT